MMGFALLLRNFAGLRDEISDLIGDAGWGHQLYIMKGPSVRRGKIAKMLEALASGNVVWYYLYFRGSSSVVEHLVANERVAGSNLVSRSKDSKK